MSTSTIPLKRTTLYKNDLGYFERTIPSSQLPSVIQVAKKHKKLVIDTLCTTASTVTFDTEEYDKYVVANTTERFFSFNDLSSATSFADFLHTCIGAEIVFTIKGNNKEQFGKLVMLDEEKTVINPNTYDVKKNHFLQILGRDGFIRHVDRK
jgi:hypothetical protein